MPDLTALIDAVRVRATSPDTQTDMSDWRPLPPPATVGDMATAESMLGSPLPGALRRVYSEVANGGFGPGYGLNRIIDTRSDATRAVSCVNHYLNGRAHPNSNWKVGVLPVGNWGCGIYSGVDITQPHSPMFCITSDFLYERDPSLAALAVSPLAVTFTEWLQAWIDGENLWESLMAELESSQP